MKKRNIENLIKRGLSFLLIPIEGLGEFIQVLIAYIAHKTDWFITFLQTFTIKSLMVTADIKFFALSRLILSRGKYGNRIRDITVIGLSVAVFLLSGVFQGTIVTEANEGITDFIPSSTNSLLSGYITITTQSGEKVLLDKPREHIVKTGETLQSIGKKYGISFGSIQFANNLTGTRLKVGQKLQIPPVEGTLHTVKKGDTVEKLAKRYSVPSQAIVDFNYLDAPYALNVGNIITIPNAKRPTTNRYYSGKTTYGLSAYGMFPNAGNVKPGDVQFVWPFAGVLTQGFNRYHPAVDIAARTGDVRAVANGVIVRSGWWSGGYGNAIQINHENGYITTYAHMSVLIVSVGDRVKKGQKIGVVGSTGRSTGPHVHFTIQRGQSYVNPLEYLP